MNNSYVTDTMALIFQLEKRRSNQNIKLILSTELSQNLFPAVPGNLYLHSPLLGQIFYPGF